jgi:hypothetical protein
MGIGYESVFVGIDVEIGRALKRFSHSRLHGLSRE